MERKSDTERILVLFNRSEETAIVELEAGDQPWTELFEGNHRTAIDQGVLAIELPAYGYAVMRTELAEQY